MLPLDPFDPLNSPFGPRVPKGFGWWYTAAIVAVAAFYFASLIFN